MDDEYYIGVACKCCVGEDKFNYMKQLSGQNESKLTWANIFVNANYKYFTTDFVSALQGKNVILVGNYNGKLENLPFKIKHYIGVGPDAWITDYYVSRLLRTMMDETKTMDHIFLFAAGPLANILTYELWNHNKNNTYIDIGSTLDKYLGLKITRGYLSGADTLNKVCVW
jgi:hypothetical protein